jgi:putative oxidoreductase
MLVLRVICGALIIPHGYDKLVHFSSLKSNFINLFGIGSTTSLALVIFAEFFCGMFLVVGLFTRIAVIPLFVTMGVALYKAHNLDFFGQGEKAALFLAAFFTILLCGPGRISVDGMIK